MSKITKRDRRKWLAALKTLDDWDGAHDRRGENAIPRWVTRRELKRLGCNGNNSKLQKRNV
jgi:hypothetical protein